MKKPRVQNKESIVKAMKLAGIGNDIIASVVGMTEHQLVATYRHVLATCEAEADSQVTLWLFDKCRQGDVSAMKVWLDRSDKGRASTIRRRKLTLRPTTTLRRYD